MSRAMRIVDVRELSVPLEAGIANALVNFSEHTVSLVALITDQVRYGKPVIGMAFNSIGRFSQSGIIRERMLPRLLAAEPSQLLAKEGEGFCPEQVLRVIMTNEKPGGHGDRASAAAAIELAVWDINAKLSGQPVYRLLADQYAPQQQADRTRTLTLPSVPSYAAGGYYYPSEGIDRLKAELESYQALGFESVKIKVGGLALKEDIARVEAAIDVAGHASRVAVDANGRFDLNAALEYARVLSELGVRWFEEPVDPLAFQSNRLLCEAHEGAIATGENLFSHQDVANLLQFAGLRADRDILQMDPGLSYGLTEYLKILSLVEAAGFSRSQCMPHGGHLINLHIVAGLSLGGCEAYPGVFQPFGGFGDDVEIKNGKVSPPEVPGFGLETSSRLRPYLKQLADL